MLQRYERYCITRRAASISIFAELPRPSSATTATVIGETMRPPLWLHTYLTVGIRLCLSLNFPGLSAAGAGPLITKTERPRSANLLQMPRGLMCNMR